jgi:CDP-diglyceride synthetase
VLRLILAFVDIALHRQSPANLPASRFFFTAVLVVYLAVALITTRYLDIVKYPELMTAFETVLGLAFIWSVLRLFERQTRFRQTACAVLGTDTLLNLLTVPLVIWHRSLGALETETTLPLVLYVLVAIWSVDISAFIMARAIERPYVLTVAIMLGYLLLSVSVRATLFPPTT